MGSMVERVARAIYEKWAESEGSETTWAELLRMNSLDGYKHAKSVYRLAIKEARAAIHEIWEAITPEMIEGMEEMYMPMGDMRAAWDGAFCAALNEQVAG